MRHVSEEGLNLIKRFEGFSPVIYRDAARLATIGYGHLVRTGEQFPSLISEEDAERLLAKDVIHAERSVLRLTKRPLSDGQFDALVSFVFNVGAGAYQRSTLRSKVNGVYDAEVPGELMKWVRAGGKILPGLIRRRKAEGERWLES